MFTEVRRKQMTQIPYSFSSFKKNDALGMKAQPEVSFPGWPQPVRTEWKFPETSISYIHFQS